MIGGTTVTVFLGWEVPIFVEIGRQLQSDDGYSSSELAFLLIHGVFMAIIIGPWSAVCMASVCLFKLVMLAHQSDMESHFQVMKQTMTQSMDMLAKEHQAIKDELASTKTKSTHHSTTHSIHQSINHPKRDLIAEVFRPLVKHHQGCRSRLRLTCSYFDYLCLGYLLTSILMIVSATLDLSRYAQGRPFKNDRFDDVASQMMPHIVQDGFFLGLGLLGLYAILYVPSSLSRSFERFIRRINDLVMAFPQSSYSQSNACIHPSSLAGLISYYHNSATAYTLFGWPITFSFSAKLQGALTLGIFYMIWIISM